MEMTVQERAMALRNTGKNYDQIVEILNDEGYTTPRTGAAIEKQHIAGYLHTMRKGSNGSRGVSRVESIAARHATIEAQIQALKKEQFEGINELPRKVFEDGEALLEFQVTPEGCLEINSFELNHDQTMSLAAWFKENF